MRENRLCVIPDGLLWVFIAFPLTRGNISGLMPAHYLHNSRHNGALLSLWTLPRLFNVFTQNQLPKGALYTSSEVKGESHSHSVQTHTHTLRVSTPLCLFPPHSLASCLWLYSSSQSWTSEFHGEVCQDVRLDICAKCLYWLWQSAGIPIVIVMECTSRGQTHYVTNNCWLFYGLGL